MRILSKPALIDFYKRRLHADAKAPLLSWYGHVLHAEWTGPADVKADFRTASILKNGRTVFNIHGNKYRLVTEINYAAGMVYIKFVGTHNEYDAIDAQTVSWRKR
ncbi:type II toxin-antitoxin system HigB family toxin [Rugamonas sp.]|uniref:type II toxin-antitoxin system HigB family toxin n=1 Tax=Rugamonas sp. TaxID=1926287 RepID=UPI0025DB105C|nr:type II toxin-antitoxin system HigB family toxin [Rugamonas sp.]